jgi:hypothetical protein
MRGIRFDQLGSAKLMKILPVISNGTSPPTTPKSQSSAARELRDLEKHLGSTIDLVVQDRTSTVHF